jgi:hypothetical protein
MNFDFTEDQNALRELARKILTDQSTDERLKSLKAAGEWHDKQTWDALGRRASSAVAVPRRMAARAWGRRARAPLRRSGAVAQVPVFASLVLARWRSPSSARTQRAAWLPRLAGTTVPHRGADRGRARRSADAADHRAA